MHTRAIQTAVFEDIAQRANLTSFELKGYRGKLTERQWHAIFCQQMIHHMTYKKHVEGHCSCTLYYDGER